MSVKERLKKFIKSQKMTVSGFEKDINVSNGYVNSISKGIGGEILLTILEKSPNLNLNWLLTGEGEMLKNELKNSFNQTISGNNNTMAGNDMTIDNNSRATIEALTKEIKELNNRILEKDKQINKLINLIDKLQ